MKSFTHHNARSLREASKLLAKYNGKAKVNAGGTDLLGAMRDKSLPVYPEAVINIKTIESLAYIKKDAKRLRIGALTKLADILRSPDVKEDYGLLVEAVHSVATPHVRNMATIGGNLAQDVRCWYYRYPAQIGGPIVCLRKGGKICSALAGDNRYHSLFGAAPLAQYPCAGNCPAHTNMPAYLSRVRNSDFAGAAHILIDCNPIPAVTGRICPVFCEPECNRRALDDSVAIQCVERAMGDYMLDHADEFYRPPVRESGKKVAIVGSGPSGLAAAFYLRRDGHEVTIYEKMPQAGGMLLYSIPAYRLPKNVVRRQIAVLKGMGIGVEVGVDVGRTVPLDSLKKEFDAVFMAVGTWKSLKLRVPGEEAQGVHYALDYLKKINSGETVSLGNRVIVVGGGSVAIDAARTARRLGTGEVHVVCLECRDPESKDRMLALDSEIREAEEEGILIHPSLGVKEIVTKAGRVAGIESVTCTSVRDPDGTFNPQYDMACTALALEAESIIVAIGQTVDPSLAAIPEGSDEKVFAGGDMVSGPATVIQAVASAKIAARIMGAHLGTDQTTPEEKGTESRFIESCFEEIPRKVIHEIPPSERVKGIDMEDVPGFSLAEAERESHRCFNCGCLAVVSSDIGVGLVALGATIVTTKRIVAAQDFFRASATGSTVLELDELIKEIRIPKPPAGAQQRYDKFTLRKPIDFAVVSVASVLTVKDGVCKDARVVLGAVAPEPLRLKETENFLRGRIIDEATATQAAQAAVEGAVPLAMNDYKVDITRALVKRAILNG
jgi:NADPH-dependent glutamate synthase beta subunit-like oxidoreductase/CO/xanthine dehydrogenase FAD-binding subunit